MSPRRRARRPRQARCLRPTLQRSAVQTCDAKRCPRRIALSPARSPASPTANALPTRRSCLSFQPSPPSTLPARYSPPFALSPSQAPRTAPPTRVSLHLARATHDDRSSRSASAASPPFGCRRSATYFQATAPSDSPVTAPLLPSPPPLH